MSRGMLITLAGLALTIVAVVVGNRLYQSYRDEQAEAANERQRYFPDDLQCAPTFHNFENALQHSLNASPVVAMIYLDDTDRQKVHLETHLDGGSKCDSTLLRTTYKDPRVGRLLKHCGITYLDCVQSDAAINVTW